jgi:localization factor PodJL
MRPDLPWNVAGIPSEAREAARAAARREGLSVGEWLTRRIVSGLAGIEPQTESHQEWMNYPADQGVESRRESETRRESDDMLARVSRSESETADIYKRIEDQLRTVGRRLETAEKNQSESHRAMSRAADEMNETVREQTHAFDQLGTHVTALSDRLERLERQPGQTDSLQDAVKALHQGMARLADQIAKTAGQSETQIAALASNLESLAGRLGQARHEAETANAALENRLAVLGAKFNERIQAVETAKPALPPDIADAVGKLTDSVRRLESRSNEPAPNQAIEKRLSGIERTLGDLLGRMDDGDAGASHQIEDALAKLSHRLDAAEKAQAEALGTIRERLDDKTTAAASPPPFATTPVPSAFAGPSAQSAPPPFIDSSTVAPPPFVEAPNANILNTGAPFAAPGAAPADSSADGYLAAARRSALAAQAEAENQSGPFSNFSWGNGQKQEAAAPKSKRGLSVGIGVLALVVAIAAIASTILSHRLPSAPAPATVSQPQVKPSLPAPTPKTTATTEAEVPAPADAAQPAAQGKSVLDNLTTLASGGNAKAALVLGLKYLEGSGVPANDQTAAKWLERAASAHEPVAQYRYAVMVEHGRGIKADRAAAAKLYAAAANQGNRKAMHNLASAYAAGSGVKQDYAEAARWFQRAANLGLSDSQFNLAVLYERGIGVPQSQTEAYKWYAIAAANGDTEAKTRMNALAGQLSPDALKAAQGAVTNFKPVPLDPRANVAPPEAALAGRG